MSVVRSIACAAVVALVSAPLLPGHAAAPAGQYTNNGNATITDNRTGLIWQRALTGTKYSYAGAVAYCAGIALGGSTNWRLPEISELQSIYDPCDSSYFDSGYFIGSVSGYIWSNTPYAPDTTQAWTLSNNSFHAPKTDLGVVRCVR